VHFDGNSATSVGGAIASFAPATSITGCTFTGNAADGSGGAVFAEGDTLTINQVSVKGQPWWLR
jgi:predicted outer membrane repeat protein